MVMLEVKKTSCTSTVVMVTELGLRKKKTLEFCAVMNMTIGNSSSIRRQVTYVVAFESSLSKS